ncbi:hypothetical protein AB1E33_15395 [Ruegeria sp. 2012CJ15-1]
MIDKLTPHAPALFAKHTAAARAYQLRYLARRAIIDRDADRALSLVKSTFTQSLRPLIEEPVKSGITILAAIFLYAGGSLALDLLSSARAQKDA